jgi:hypothetical protein
MVTDTRTILIASGTDDELVRFYGRVSRYLSDLPLSRVVMERRILRQEEATRPRSTADTMAWLRFGSVGHGLVGCPEFGLTWLGPEPISSWACTKFVADNAAIWSSAELPKGLRLDLPRGTRADPVAVETVPGTSLPAFMQWRNNEVAVSYLVKRSPAARASAEIAAHRAREVLRFERGLVYDLTESYEPLNATTAHCVLAADCRSEDAAVVTAEIVGALDDIAAGGLRDPEIRRVVRAFHDSRDLPESLMGLLDGATVEELDDGPHHTLEEIVELYESLDAAAGSTVMSEAVGSLLVASPTHAPQGRAWTDYPVSSPTSVEGRQFHPQGWPLRTKGRRDRLIVGPDGVTWLSGAGGQSTVRYQDCVAYQHWQGSIREMYGADGFRIQIAASDWRDGEVAVRLIDAAVPIDVVACDEHGLGGLEDPPEPSASAIPPADIPPSPADLQSRAGDHRTG